MMKHLLSRKNTLVLANFFIGLTLLLLLSHHAYATAIIPDGGGNGLGSQSPASGSLRYGSTIADSSNFTSVGQSDAPIYDIGNSGGDYTYGDMQTKAYVNTAWGSSFTITVFNAADDCYSSTGGGVVGPDYYSQGGAFQTAYTIIGNGWSQTKTITTGGCTATVDFTVPVSNALGVTPTNHYNGFFWIKASIPPQLNQGENGFFYAIDNNATYGGVIGAGSNVFGLGHRLYNLNNGNYWNAWSSFALPLTCDQLGSSATQNYSVNILDIDALTHPEWNSQMIFLLQEERLDNSNNPISGWNTVASRSQSQGFSSGGQSWTFTYNFRYDSIYRVAMINIGVRNTIREEIDNGLSTLYSKLPERPSTTTCAPAVSCTATPSTATPNYGQSVTMKVILKNSSTSNQPVPSTDQFRQVSPSGGAQMVQSGGIAPGGLQPFTFTIAARNKGDPNPVTFQYALFNGTTSGATAVGNNPLCSAIVFWGAGNTYKGTITSYCSVTNVTLTSVASDYYYTTASPGYWVALATDAPYGKAPDGNWYWLGPSEPPEASPQPPDSGSAGGTATGADGTLYDWYGDLYGTEKPASVIPYKVVFKDLNGNTVDTYSSSVSGANQGNGTSYGQASQGTFNVMGPHLWPHMQYTATLLGEVQPSDNFNRGDQSTWTDYIPLASAVVTDQRDGSQTCLHTSVSTACVGPSTDPGPVEPGQNYTFTYGVKLTNDTNKTFSGSDPGGYNFVVSTSGGLAYLGGVPASTGSIPPGTNTITVSIPARVDSTGSFGVYFKFQSTQLAFDGWEGSCGVGGTGPPGSDTPATRPYFQVWNSDTSTGGGFSSPAGACPTTSPGYISPVTTSGNQYTGGVRAYGAQSPDRGSRTDFGVIALGLIQGSPGGPVGFYSGDTANSLRATFSNQVSQMGGYLNSSSSAHCVDDYFTKTRTSSTLSSFPGFASTTASGQYSVSSGSFLSGGTLGQNQQITIYVDGNVTINGNINYPASFNPSDQTQIPYFVLIARGNISVGAGVTHLDGLYVAQPTTSGSGGVFATCNSQCPSQLVINGAVIAQHVELLRSHGSLGPCDLVNSQNCSLIGNNPAEIINFVPSMLIGTPYFSSSFGNLEGIFSLPPVF